MKKVNSVIENEDKSTNMVLRQVNNIDDDGDNDDDTGGGSNDDNGVVMVMMMTMVVKMEEEEEEEEKKEKEEKEEKKKKKKMVIVVIMIILLHYTVRCQPLVSSKCLGTQQTRHSFDNNNNTNTGRVYTCKLTRTLRSSIQKLPSPKLGTNHESHWTRYQRFQIYIKFSHSPFLSMLKFQQ